MTTTTTTSDETGDGPRVHRCEGCGAPIADLVIAEYCDGCSQHLGADNYQTEPVTEDLLHGERDRVGGCLYCRTTTEQVFCTTECSEHWFSKYTDAYLR